MSRWIKKAAEMIGMDTKKIEITNHSSRSSTGSHLAKAGGNQQEIIKITGHSSSNSLKPYLELDNKHHSNLINNLRDKREAINLNSTEQAKSTTHG